MSFLLPLVLLIIFAVVTALNGKNGLWSNAILLVNVTLAGLVATILWEPLATWLSSKAPTWSAYFDFLCLWVLFAAILVVLRLVTDYFSASQLRFPKRVELIGNWVLAGWTSWVFLCFLAMTLHTVPLGREYFFGGFKAEEPILFGVVAPDRLWLGFVQRLSMGSLSRGGTPQDSEAYVFDPYGDFMLRYAARRQSLETPPE